MIAPHQPRPLEEIISEAIGVIDENANSRQEALEIACAEAVKAANLLGARYATREIAIPLAKFVSEYGQPLEDAGAAISRAVESDRRTQANGHAGHNPRPPTSKSKERLAKRTRDVIIADYVRGALDGAHAAIKGAKDRNNELNSQAYGLGQLVGAGALPRAEAETVLESASIACKLDKDDGALAGVRATIKSGLDAGALKPRDLSKIGNGKRERPSKEEQRARTEARAWAEAEAAKRREEDKVKAAQNRKSAAKIWDRCKPIASTLAETYFRTRGIDLQIWPDTLGFYSDVFNKETGADLPAMVGVVTDRPGGRFAVHRTWLTDDGKGKAALNKPKMALGEYGDGAIWFGTPGPRLAITEGIENALSVLMAGETFACAAVGGSNVGNIIPPDGVSEIIVFGDRAKDSDGIDETGRKALKKGAPRWTEAGFIVRFALTPAPHKDANDLLKRGGRP